MDTKMSFSAGSTSSQFAWLASIKKPSQTIGSGNWILMSDEINASEC
jgi:hypothetical protein